MFVVAVYWPHASREKAPFREDTANEMLKLLRNKVSRSEDGVITDAICILGDFNSRLAKDDKGFTGTFSPHARGDDGGSLMREIMAEFSLYAVNTVFQPDKRSARNTGNATYCMDKGYIQPANKRYQSDQPPAIID